jgi:hypothetical protein
VIVLGAIAVAISVAGHGAPLKPADRNEAQAPASLTAPATVSQSSATPSRSSKAQAVVPVSARHGRSAHAASPSSSQGSTSPAQPVKSPSPQSSSPSVQLTASVDVYGGHHNSVVFQVSDTGSAGTGALVVSVALPPGSSLSSPPGHGDDQGNDGHGGQGGWSCKATSTGALCSHASIPAGGQAQGVIFIAINNSSACGQTVSVTAASGSASASAHSRENIQC